MALNWLHLVKLLAIVNMTIDHVGLWFFPDVLWLRAVGRITFPVWFWLVGFSRSRDVPLSWLCFCGLLIAIQSMTWAGPLPINAVGSLIVCRLVVAGLERIGGADVWAWGLLVACGLLGPFTVPLWEYGSVAVIFAGLGRACRERSRAVEVLAFGGLLAFLPWQVLLFGFDAAQAAYVCVGVAAVVAVLCSSWLTREVFRPGQPLPAPVALLVENTLPYYAGHRAVFQAASFFARGIG